MLGDVADIKFKLPLLREDQSNPTDNNNNNNNNRSSSTLLSMDKFRESFAKAAGAVGLETKASQDSSTSIATEDSGTAMEEISEFCPKLSFKQRLIGFVICYVAGYMITFSSFHYFVRLVEGHPMPFVVSYTFGNILSLLSSMFLCGPNRQYKSMMDDKRKYTSVIYISSLVLTIILCFIPMNRKVKLFFLLNLVFIQFCAMVWYNLSYVPFGRRTAKKVFKDFTGIEELV